MKNFAKTAAKICLLAAIGQVAIYAPAQGVKLPPYKKATLRNGLTVVMMEQHKVPLIDIQLTFKTGSTSDPEGKEGTASMAAGLLRKGTGKMDSLQISEALDSMGARFGTGAGRDSIACTAQFMAKDISKGMGLFAELVMSPAFPEDEFKKAQAQSLDGLRAVKDSAGAVIGTYFTKFFHGPHPYARVSDESSVAAITQADIVEFHGSNFAPSNAILVVVGDFKTAEMERAISNAFGSWKSSAKPRPAAMPEPAPLKGTKLLLVDKPDATQTYFAIGNLGVARDCPDRVAIQVVNTLFGGRFTSMINTALRIKSGLTYGASAGFSMNGRAAGPFIISSFTANATTEKALELAIETLKELHGKEFTEEELGSAKAYIKGSYPTENFETSGQLAGCLTDLVLHGLPDSDVNDFFKKVDSVTPAEAKRIVKAYYPLDDLCFVLVGKAEEIRPAAEKFSADITEKSISGPGF